MCAAGDSIWLRVCLVAVLIGCGYTISCDVGWIGFGDSCYMFGINQSVNFLQAEDICYNLDSRLVQIETAEENNFIKAKLKSLHKYEEYWLGLTDNATEKEWYWYDSEAPVYFSDWRPHEPNNAHKENCGVMALQEYTWNDVHCRDLHEPICEIRKCYYCLFDPDDLPLCSSHRMSVAEATTCLGYRLQLLITKLDDQNIQHNPIGVCKELRVATC